MEQGFFTDVVRQTMAVDLSDLMEPARPRQRRIKSTHQPEGSIVAPVDKAAVLAMVDQLEAEDEVAQKQSVLAIAHSEDVTQWAAASAHWMQSASTHQVVFAQLCQSSGLARVEVWRHIVQRFPVRATRGSFMSRPFG